MKVLLIHASAGAGHTRAAEAIYRGLNGNSAFEPVLVDALDYTSPTFKALYREAYAGLVKHVPALWATGFSLMGLPFLRGPLRWKRRFYNHWNAKALETFLIRENFDYVVSTHFMPTEVMSAIKRSGTISTRLITVVTDYDVHQIWIAPGVDFYCVACDWTKEKMERMGVPGEKIIVTGIPVDERFSARPDITALKELLGLPGNRFTVLVATGSFGLGPMETLASSIPADFQVVMVCGKNQVLRKKIQDRHLSNVIALGQVDNMHELMAASDVMITKPGGLSVSEAMSAHLPMIFFSPIPGQETGNMRVLTDHEVGSPRMSVSAIVKELEHMRESKDYYRTLLLRSSLLARPRAVKDIIELLV
jgi:processive 1,2-diacylglycerol beta-glucosyltransferase